jgi:hypothetical protein
MWLSFLSIGAHGNSTFLVECIPLFKHTKDVVELIMDEEGS